MNPNNNKNNNNTLVAADDRMQIINNTLINAEKLSENEWIKNQFESAVVLDSLSSMEDPKFVAWKAWKTYKSYGEDHRYVAWKQELDAEAEALALARDAEISNFVVHQKNVRALAKYYNDVALDTQWEDTEYEFLLVFEIREYEAGFSERVTDVELAHYEDETQNQSMIDDDDCNQWLMTMNAVKNLVETQNQSMIDDDDDDDDDCNQWLMTMTLAQEAEEAKALALAEEDDSKYDELPLHERYTWYSTDEDDSDSEEDKA
jgi:hypothetical protein